MPSLRHNRRRGGARAVLCLLASTLVFALAGCGSSSGSGSTVTPKRYATALCGALGPFETDIARRQSALDPANIRSPDQGKSALVGFLDAITSDTGKAVSRLKSAGAPDVKNGKRIAGAFVSLFQRLENTLRAASDQAHHLPTSSPQAFKTAASSLAASVKSTMGNLGAGLTGFRSPALEKAAKQVKACQGL